MKVSWHDARASLLLVLLAATVPQGSSAAPRPPVSRSDLQNAIDLSADYLVRACDADGRFTYQIDVASGKIKHNKYNILRHAGAVYALSAYVGSSASAPGQDVAKRAAGYLRRTALRPVPGERGLLAVWSGPQELGRRKPEQAKLGGAGLGLVALLSVEAIAPGTTPLDDLRALGRFILFMQQADGSFYSKYIPADDGRDDSWTSLYYPGEAALGLTMLHELDPSGPWLEAAARALAYLARSREGVAVLPPDHWALLATARLLPLYSRTTQPLPSDAIVRHGVRICESILDTRYPFPAGSPFHGALTPEGTTAQTATRLEGLLAALSFLPGEAVALRHRIETAAGDGIGFLMRTQVRSGAAKGAVPRSPAASPALRPREAQVAARRSAEGRVDYVQHTLSALLLYAQAGLAGPP